MPYRFWMLQRIQDAFAAVSPEGQARIRAILDGAGLGDMLSLRTNRRVERRNHLEVWA